MTDSGLAFLQSGLVTAVGANASASCAAIRAKLNNPSETRFSSSDGGWIMAHSVAFDGRLRGIAKLAGMAASAIEEALQGVSSQEWPSIPMLLCVAEQHRPGRLEGLDDQLFLDVQARLGGRFSKESAIVSSGRVGVALALKQAHALVNAGRCQCVLVVAADSFIMWPTLSYYDRQGRLLTEENPDGFMPGEGAGALLVGSASGKPGELVCAGIGLARESATVASGEPLRGEGLAQAMTAALAQARWNLAESSCYRISDTSGEQYYFKEASLALSRAIRYRKQNFELWHPAESMGEAGAATALACLVVAQTAARKQYAPSERTIVHFGNDDGARAVILTCLT